MIGAAASAEHGKLRVSASQIAILAGELDRIAGVEIGRFIELPMALPRGIGADAANALRPFLALFQDVFEVGRMGTIDHVVGGALLVGAVHFINGLGQRLPGRQPPVGLERERDGDRQSGFCR